MERDVEDRVQAVLPLLRCPRSVARESDIRLLDRCTGQMSLERNHARIQRTISGCSSRVSRRITAPSASSWSSRAHCRIASSHRACGRAPRRACRRHPARINALVRAVTYLEHLANERQDEGRHDDGDCDGKRAPQPPRRTVRHVVVILQRGNVSLGPSPLFRPLLRRQPQGLVIARPLPPPRPATPLSVAVSPTTH